MKTVLGVSEIILYNGNDELFTSNVEHWTSYDESFNLIKRNHNIIIGKYKHVENRHIANIENAIFVKLLEGDKKHIYLPETFEERFSETELMFLIRKFEAFLTIDDIIDFSKVTNNMLDIITDNLALSTFNIEERQNVTSDVFGNIRRYHEDGDIYDDQWKIDLRSRLDNIFS